MSKSLALITVAALFWGAARAATVRGDYLETRTADVWTGPCFANGEVNLTGREAILAWRVSDGAWNGIPLDGLVVVGVVRADTTLGDPFAAPSVTRARVLVDARADGAQREALAALAKDLAHGLLDGAGAPEAVAMALDVAPDGGRATLDAGGLATVRTRALGHCDRHCGNETVYYEPLTPVHDAVAVFALTNAWRGAGLGATWNDADKRSAFLARFER